MYNRPVVSSHIYRNQEMSEQLATLVAQLKERRALTFQERIKSLDIRDEIWRKCKIFHWKYSYSSRFIDIELNKGSSFDSTAAQRTGLCPDMCCERERLTREYQRLYKSYELDSDTRAVRIIIPLFLLFNSEEYFCS